MAQRVLLVLLFAVVLPALSSAAPSDRKTDLLTLSSIAKDFDDACNALGLLVPIPYIKSNELCATSGFTNDTDMCLLLGLVEKGLMYISQKKKGSSCTGALQSPSASTSSTGVALPFSLSDQRPLPTTLPSQLLASEGASYYWLWRNLLNFELWAGCAATNTSQTVTTGTPTVGNASQNWAVPSNWTVYSTIWQADGGNMPDSGLYWPFATVMYKGDSVVVFIRGTETIMDWMTDFTYNQNAARLMMYLPTPGRVHVGFATVAASLWPSVRSALNSIVKHQSTGTTINNVYVAGHSLGAGVASLISFAAQSYLESRVKVDALLFAPPNVGDSAFAASFGKRVNARRLPFLYDLIPQVPCTPAMIGCKDTLINTNTPNHKGLWSYTSGPGTLLLLPSGMPQQPQAWSLLHTLYPCEIGRFLRATHICSYNCYLSQYVVDNNSMCKLWNETIGAGSYCFDFPVTSGPQYPYVPV